MDFCFFDINSLICLILFIASIMLIISFILCVKRTKTEKLIKEHNKFKLQSKNKLESKKNNTDLDYNIYYSEQNIFKEWNKRYGVILVLCLLGITLFISGLILILNKQSFFADVSPVELSSLIIGICTLISTIMIAIIQFVNQKNLRLLENSRQGKMSLFAKKEKQENEIFNCFSSLKHFRIFNFLNQNESYLVKTVCKDFFGEVGISYDEVSFLIALPLKNDLLFLGYSIDEILINTSSISNEVSNSNDLFYELADNFIFAFYKKTIQFDKNPILYCINNFRNNQKFRIIINLSSKITDIKASISIEAMIISLVDEQHPTIDGIYCVDINNIEYQFD